MTDLKDVKKDEKREEKRGMSLRPRNYAIPMPQLLEKTINTDKPSAVTKKFRVYKDLDVKFALETRSDNQSDRELLDIIRMITQFYDPINVQGERAIQTEAFQKKMQAVTSRSDFGACNKDLFMLANILLNALQLSETIKFQVVKSGDFANKQATVKKLIALREAFLEMKGARNSQSRSSASNKFDHLFLNYELYLNYYLKTAIQADRSTSSTVAEFYAKLLKEIATDNEGIYKQINVHPSPSQYTVAATVAALSISQPAPPPTLITPVPVRSGDVVGQLSSLLSAQAQLQSPTLEKKDKSSEDTQPKSAVETKGEAKTDAVKSHKSDEAKKDETKKDEAKKDEAKSEHKEMEEVKHEEVHVVSHEEKEQKVLAFTPTYEQLWRVPRAGYGRVERPERLAMAIKAVERSDQVQILEQKELDISGYGAYRNVQIVHRKTAEIKAEKPVVYCNQDEDGNDVLDNPVNSFTENALIQGIQQDINLTRAVLEAKAGQTAIGMQRIPGHHARNSGDEATRFSGFCFYNHSITALEAATPVLDAKNDCAMVVSIDGHDSNGTKDDLKNTSFSDGLLPTYFVNACNGNAFPYSSEEGDFAAVDEKGTQHGKHFFYSKAFNTDELNDENLLAYYRQQFEAVKKHITESGKNLKVLVLECGLDLHAKDRMGIGSTTSQFYRKFMALLQQMFYPTKVIVFSEGGYNPTVSKEVYPQIVDSLAKYQRNEPIVVEASTAAVAPAVRARSTETRQRRLTLLERRRARSSTDASIFSSVGSMVSTSPMVSGERMPSLLITSKRKSVHQDDVNDVVELKDGDDEVVDITELRTKQLRGVNISSPQQARQRSEPEFVAEESVLPRVAATTAAEVVGHREEDPVTKTFNELMEQADRIIAFTPRKQDSYSATGGLTLSERAHHALLFSRAVQKEDEKKEDEEEKKKLSSQHSFLTSPNSRMQT